MARHHNPHERVKQQGDKLLVETEGRFSARTVIEHTKAVGWESLDIVESSPELKRAVWLEGSMNDIAVTGYQPTVADKALLKQLERERRTWPGQTITLRADQVAADYVRRVIPVLYQSYKTLDTQLWKQTICPNEIRQETGNCRRGSIAARELENRLDYSKQALKNAHEAADYFSGLGQREMRVRETFEDGISRFIADGVNQRRMPERDFGRAKKLVH